MLALDRAQLRTEVEQPSLFAATDEQRRIIEQHPLDRPAVIDAGAGTGKTEVIVRRVAWLAAGGICAPDRILLLTFANKAAAELRRRVAEELGPGSPLPRCSTFHAFALDILRDHCYEIGVAPDVEVIDEPEARLMFWRVFDDWVADAAATGVSAFPLRPVRRDELREALFEICRDIKQQGRTFDEFRQRALSAADSFAQISYRQLRRLYAKTYRGADSKVEAEVDDARFAQEISEEKARATAATALFYRYQRALDEANVLTYADLIERAERAIREHETIARQLRRRFLCCIVDEYQDTDEGQHRFLQALFPGLQSVSVLGDVRQSIYGFRGARPRSVELFKSAEGCAEYPLTLNRRSFQEILDIAGSVIADPAEPQTSLVADRGAAPGQVVRIASKWARPGVRLTADEARELEADYVAAHIAQLLQQSRRAREIAVLSRNKTKVQPLTEALLARGIPFQLVGGVGFYDAPEILDATAWLHLLADPFDAQALARVAAAPGIGISDAALVDIARDMERDVSTFARRLLVEPVPDGVAADDRERIDRLRATIDALESFAALPLCDALEAVLDRSGLRLSWELSDEPRSAQALANLRKLGVLARNFVTKLPSARSSDFVRLLHELSIIEIDEREADVGDAEAVSIMTIHAAKGLEWPVVFVTGVWPPPTHGRLIWVDEASGAFLCREGSDGREPFHSASVRLGADSGGMLPSGTAASADLQRDLEERRLFYVALTRARDELFVTGIRRQASRPNPHGTAHGFLDEIYAFAESRRWPQDEIIETVVEGKRLSPETDGARDSSDLDLGPMMFGMTKARAAVRPVGERAVSFSSIQAYEQCPRRSRYAVILQLPGCAESGRIWRASSTEATDGDEPPQGSLAGAGLFGRLVHRALELWARDSMIGLSAQASENYVDQATRDYGASIDGKTRAKSSAAVTAARAALEGWQPRLVEAHFAIEFSAVDRPVEITGYIDLIAEDASGRWLIVDYKTGILTGADYALQLALYREAARRAYGVEKADAVILRIGDDGAKFERTEELDADTVRRRVIAAADGLRQADDTPRAGSWCKSCPYRAAPCQDYLRKGA